jgi:hypothetical protein
VNIGWETTRYEWNGMIMGTMGRWEALGVSKTEWCLDKISCIWR